MVRDVILLLGLALGLAACSPSDDFAACTAGDGGPEAVSACSRVVLITKILPLGRQFKTHDLAKVYTARGRHLAATGELDSAIVDFGEVIRLEPRETQALLERAAAYQKLGNHDLAIADLSELIRRDARRASHYAARGKAYQAKGDDEGALRDLNQAIAMDPGDPFYKIARAASHRRKRDHDRAIADAAAAIAIQPYFAVFYLERADSLLRKGGNAERALADLDQAIKLEPGLAIAHSRRAVALTLLKAPGDPHRAPAGRPRGRACATPARKSGG